MLTNKFELFNKVVQSFTSIFNEVERVSPETIDNHSVVITNIQIKFKGREQTIPIQECGSGFYHVLILLTLIHSEQDSKVILFDEPNSYLHPSAEKSVYDLSTLQSNHHFVFTSHSHILVNYPCEKNIYLVKNKEGRSNYFKIQEVGPIVEELGIHNSDFAFADRIIFVEGPTERNELPKILEHFGMPQVGYNYSLVSLKGTGDEFKIEKAMVSNARVYDELFSCISTQPIPHLFFIDRDERKYDTLKKHYNEERIVLLMKREFENYLLHPQAIQFFLKEVFNQQVAVEQIEAFIEHCLKMITDKKYFPEGLISDPASDIKGSKVLDDMIKKFVSEDYTYSKPKNGAF
ncbi:ATP-dependent nuclease [Paenibacillus sp. sptzw28]|uniref:ATP-dependent nuclease n=1 Tax=Paenibacillus sp. sptzw28 TaxID=715179 RepID=UPI0037C82AEA